MDGVCFTDSFPDVLAVEVERENDEAPRSDFTTVLKTIEAQLSCTSYGGSGPRPLAAGSVEAYRAAQRQYSTRDVDRPALAMVPFDM